MIIDCYVNTIVGDNALYSGFHLMWALVNMAKIVCPNTNKVKKNCVIWILNSVNVGNFYFIIVLEYTCIYLKATNLIRFRSIYKICLSKVFISITIYTLKPLSAY